MRDLAGHKYSLVAISLHWLMAALIIANLALAKFSEHLPRDLRIQLMYQHKALGTILLALIVWRLLWRLAHAVPPLPKDTPKFNVLMAHLGHWTLYGAMIFVPLTGFLKVLVQGRALGLWFFELQSPFVSDTAMAKLLGEMHNLSGNLTIFLVAGHIIAAIYHQYFIKDNLIARITP